MGMYTGMSTTVRTGLLMVTVIISRCVIGNFFGNHGRVGNYRRGCILRGMMIVLHHLHIAGVVHGMHA